jgi:hypothetical protein
MLADAATVNSRRTNSNTLTLTHQMLSTKRLRYLGNLAVVGFGECAVAILQQLPPVRAQRVQLASRVKHDRIAAVKEINFTQPDSSLRGSEGRSSLSGWMAGKIAASFRI